MSCDDGDGSGGGNGSSTSSKLSLGTVPRHRLKIVPRKVRHTCSDGGGVAVIVREKKGSR